MEIMMKSYNLILACLLPLIGCGGPTSRMVDPPFDPAHEPEATLDFLSSVLEFHGFNLAMTEPELTNIVSQRKLGVDVSADGDRTTYRVWNMEGENVVIGFRDGECTGIQRMRPDPTIADEKN